MGTVSSREECHILVKERHQTANGATFTNEEGPGECYAEFEMTGVDSNTEWQNSRFEGIMFCNDFQA